MSEDNDKSLEIRHTVRNGNGTKNHRYTLEYWDMELCETDAIAKKSAEMMFGLGDQKQATGTIVGPTKKPAK